MIFHPDVIRTVVGFPKEGKNHGKQLVLPVAAMVGLAALGALRVLGAAPRWASVATTLLTIPPAIVTAANLEVVARNHVVPGAADNLSGCVAGVELARRLAPRLQVGTELVVGITGCEEAGTGGADRLAAERDRDGMWPKDTTTILAIDTLANGDLFLLEEGELSRVPVPERLARAVAETSAEPGMLQVDRYVVPTGATDCYPFLRRGWDAFAITSIDRTIGAPRHYHRPSDTAANLSPDELGRSIDFAERLSARLLGL
jgi:Zn-dependent M28 family amino/carboxypeptidase